VQVTPPACDPATAGSNASGVEAQLSAMFEWVRRETLVDVTINAIPAVVLAYFVALTAITPAWQVPSLTTAVAHFLTVFPFVVLVVATYVVARAVETDAQAVEGER